MKQKTCTVCNRDSERMNSDVAECSHIACPVRRSAWSERPTRNELFKGSWPKRVDADPTPVDVFIATGEAS